MSGIFRLWFFSCSMFMKLYSAEEYVLSMSHTEWGGERLTSDGHLSHVEF